MIQNGDRYLALVKISEPWGCTEREEFLDWLRLCQVFKESLAPEILLRFVSSRFSSLLAGKV